MLFVCHPKILHKQCFQFLLGVKMAPREAENNVMQNVGGDKQRALWYVMVLNCRGQLKNAFALACRRLLFPSLHRNFLSSLKLKNFNFLENAGFRISLVFWATELDTGLSSSICQPASICRYRAQGLSLFRGDKVKMVIELDDLSSSMTYRAR